MEEKLNSLNSDYLNKISEASSLKELDEIFISLFGKNGLVTELPKQFKDLDKEELKSVGPLFNTVKNELEKAIEVKRSGVREESYAALENESLDLDKDSQIKDRQGFLHPITEFENEVAEAFKKIGFSQYDAPHIDSDYFNFEVLNIPEGHPARDLWDTLYIEGQEKLLRTHTSNAQIRLMKEFNLPIRMMILGRCFRYENLDARHEHTFAQFELVYIDKKVNMGNLQYLSEYLLKELFGSDMKARLRPKYYPFVEPGAGVDGLCIFCKGEGGDCKVCSGVGWLELAGAGMIHPTVLKNGGIDPEEYSGIAWGFGTYRVAMLKYGTSDVRSFNSGDLNFLQKKGEM